MATYTAIADASLTLLELLRDEIAERSDAVNVSRNEIALMSPTDVGGDTNARLTLTLYGLAENSKLKNVAHRPDDDSLGRESQLALDLHYLLAAYPSQGGNDPTANTVDQHRVLGLAMQVMHDNAVLGPEDQLGSLGDGELLVVINEGDVQEAMQNINDIWYSIQDATLQPSATYTVGPITIESDVERPVTRTEESRLDFSS